MVFFSPSRHILGHYLVFGRDLFRHNYLQLLLTYSMLCLKRRYIDNKHIQL
jgi:hypothetical protein